MLVLAGLSWVESPQVGHGKGAGELGAGLAVEAAGTGMSVALAETASSGSFDSGCSIRFRLFGDWVVSFGRYRVKRIQRLRVAARFSQPAQGLIPIA